MRGTAVRHRPVEGAPRRTRAQVLMMIERRLVVAWGGRWLGGPFDRLRSVASAGPSWLRVGIEADASGPVPWGFRDLGLVVLQTVSIATATILGMILVRLVVSTLFLIGEMAWLVPDGAYDRLTASIGPYSNVLTDLVVGAGLYVGLVYAVYRQTVAKYGVSLAALGFRRVSRRTIGRVATVFVPVTIAGIAINLSSQAVVGTGTHPSQVSVLTHGMPASAGSFVILFVLLVIMAPVAEEVFFRGFLFKLIRGRCSGLASVGSTAVAFAALHGSPTVLPWLLFMGVVFGALVEQTGSLYSSIMLHAMVNGLTVLGMIIALSTS